MTVVCAHVCMYEYVCVYVCLRLMLQRFQPWNIVRGNLDSGSSPTGIPLPTTVHRMVFGHTHYLRLTLKGPPNLRFEILQNSGGICF